MKIQQLIEEQRSLFIFSCKLIETLGEELIGYDEQIVMGNSYTNIEMKARNDFRDKQRLKLKELLSNIT